MIVLELEPSTARLRLTGEFDLADLGQLHHRMADISSHLDRRRSRAPGTVILELGDLDFIDCACLHSIEAFRRYLVRRGHSFVIASTSPAFCRIARIAQFDELVGSVVASSAPPVTPSIPTQRAPGHGATAAAQDGDLSQAR